MSDQRIKNRRQDVRRGRRDQRQAGDRRRGSNSRYVVFEVCRSNIHMALVTHGAKNEPSKVVTRSLAWRKESTSLYSDAGVEELTEAIRTLVADERLAGTTASFALSGEFCVTRVVSGSTDRVRRECAEVEERSHRYLTLGPGRKVAASSVQQVDARHELALLTIANERTLSALLDIAESVGLQIETIEPSLVAMSRAQARLKNGCQEACMVIQFDDSGAELGVCYAGRLLLDYRPGGHTNAANVADVLVLHLTRLQRHLERNHGYLKSPVRQIYLAGDTAEVVAAFQTFKRFRQFDVTVLNPSQLSVNWQHMNESPGPEMAAVLGTALLDEPTEGNVSSPNLMERILAESREPMRPFLIRSLVPIAAVMLLALGLFFLFQRERGKTNVLRAELAELEPVRTRARELQAKLATTSARLAQLKELEKGLPAPGWGRLLNRIAQSMPEDVWLDDVEVTDSRTATLRGASYADGGVYDFVSYLKKVPEIREIALQGTGVGQSPTGPTTSFDLVLSLAPALDRTDQEVRHD